MNLIKSNYEKLFKILLFAGVIFFPLFLHLSYLPIRIWDEARLAINALEMSENGNFIVTFYKGNPDLWNTKPPLMIWLQVISLKIFGENELAIRFPAAFAAVLTCTIVLVFAIKYLKSYWLGLISVLVLVTSKGYVSLHGTRTGDYDSLLVLFLTMASLSFFVYINSKTKDWKYLYLTIISLTLAVLTKGIAGLLITPALFVFCVIERQFINLLKSKHLYVNMLIFIVMIGGYYLWREMLNPGYIDAVIKNELGGRYIETIENHKQDFWFYFKNITSGRFKYWYWLVPIGVIIGIIQKDEKYRKLMWFFTLIIIQFFFLISFGQTKLSWYDLPLYPYLSIIVSFPIFIIFMGIRNLRVIKLKLVYQFVPAIFLIIIFLIPYLNIINWGSKPKEHKWHQEFYNISYFMKDAVESDKDLDGYNIIYEGYNGHLYYYVKLLNKKGQNIKVASKDILQGNEKVIADQKETKSHIQENFEYQIIEKYKNIFQYKLLNGKTYE